MKIDVYLLATLVVVIALAALACGEAAVQSRAEPAFWVKVKASTRGTGPYTYITREPIAMADGTHVVCVATLNALWCKESR